MSIYRVLASQWLEHWHGTSEALYSFSSGDLRCHHVLHNDKKLLVHFKVKTTLLSTKLKTYNACQVFLLSIHNFTIQGSDV